MDDTQQPALEDSSKHEHMARVLITTIHSSDSITLLITRYSAERVFLLVNKKPHEDQTKAVDKLKEAFGNVIEIKEKRVEVYDVVDVAKTVVDIIDAISVKDEIVVNITPGRKPQALGLLFGCYARTSRVKKILYVVDETNEILTLPILSFDITDSQKKLLETIEDFDKPLELASEVETSRAMLYRNIKDLMDRGFIEAKDKEGYRLTDAGKIARM